MLVMHGQCRQCSLGCQGHCFAYELLAVHRPPPLHTSAIHCSNRAQTLTADKTLRPGNKYK